MVTLWDIFNDNITLFNDKKCVIYYDQSTQKLITYDDLKSLIEEVSVYLESFLGKYFSGLLCNDISPEVLTIILSLLKHNSGIVFIDTKTNMKMREKYRQLRIPFFILEQDDALISYMKSVFLTSNYVSEFNILNTTFEIWQSEYKYNIYDIDEVFTYAFVVCTSGSTGESKIVKITHNSLIPNILHLRDTYNITAEDIVFTSAPLTFDPSILDIFLALISGASLLLLPKEIRIQPDKLYRDMFLNDLYNVTIFSTTPSLFRRWSDDIINRLNSTALRILSLGGETCPFLDVIKRWDIMKNIKIYNLYGITEISCWASICYINEVTEQNIPLGTPIRETILQVRNEFGKIVTHGTGEMFIGSKTRVCTIDDEVANKFHDDCFRATGDLVEIRGSNYYYVGRKNRIVKVYGRQIDMAAIEKSSKKSKWVTHSCCFCVSEESKVILILQLVENIESGDDCIISEIKQLLFDEFMILPDDVIIVPQIPLNKHGKTSEIDCRIMYTGIKSKQKYSEKDMEKYFYSLWGKYTTQNITRSFNEDRNTNSFIEFGNDSVRAVQFISEFSQVFSPVPGELIVAMLGGKGAQYCYDLFKNDVSVNLIPHPYENDDDSALKKKFKHIEDSNGSTTSNKYNEKLALWKCRGRVKYVLNAKQEFLSSLKEITVFWKYNLKKCIDASPLLLIFESNKMIAICGCHSGELVAIDVTSGVLISKCVLPDRIESTPCISSNGHFIYVGCYDTNLYSINLQNGQILWNFKSGDIIKCSPVVFNQHIYFGCYDHYLYCITETGTLVWKKNIDNSSIYASVVIYLDIYIIAATLGGTAVTLDLEGNVKCKYCIGKPIFSNPLVLEDINAFCFVDVSGVIYCCSIDVETVVWKYAVNGNVFSSLAVTKSNETDELLRIIFGCYDNNLYCLSISNQCAKLHWKSYHESPIYATPFACDKHVVSASTKGIIRVLNIETGDVLISYEDSGEIFSSPVSHDNYILFGSRDDHLCCLKLFQ